jgi:hypothetical protein
VTTTVPTTTVPPASPGTIIVYSFPLGASVALNGVPVGTTPIINKPVAAGSYIMTISLAGYQTYSAPVTILPDQLTKVPLILLLRGSGTPTITTTVPTTTVTTTVTTTPPTTIPTTQATTVPTTQPTSGGATGAILMSSYPSGAMIFVDGVDTGVLTSAMVQGIPAGTHTVTLQKTGYRTESRTVIVYAARLTRMPRVTLVPATPV